jgi:integrase
LARAGFLVIVWFYYPKTLTPSWRQRNAPQALPPRQGLALSRDGFYRRRCDFHNKWDAVIKAAGIKRMTPHSGRHGFATTALKKMDPKTAAWLGGWKNIRLFMETYALAIEDITLNERVFDTELTQPEIRNARKPRKTGTS